jgi:hypothetical protein
VQQFARICRLCGEPIRTHHKFMTVTDGEASWLQHRHCDNPGSYKALDPPKLGAMREG